MCGINAIADFSGGVDATALSRMNDRLAHRGPNGEGVSLSSRKTMGLGSRRLSVVDVAGGAMPLAIEYEGSVFSIVSNGEFFNYRELREELSKKYQFKTKSDTEVALFSYIEWGEHCVEKLRGQFAFVVLDERRDRLFFARDRAGIKPLYYCLSGSRLIMSSEPKGIQAAGISTAPDPETFASFFLSTFSIGKSEPADRSFFTGIHALPPGSYALFDQSGIKIQSYYKVAIHRSNESKASLTTRLRAAVVHAIKSQLSDEVPYGIALSGGLDSSIIAAVAAHEALRPRLGVALRYEEGENSDYEYAQEIAQLEKIPLVAPIVSSVQLTSDVDAIIASLDRPFESTREIGLFEIFRSLKDGGATVALCGEGADEFNLGYYHALPGFDPVPTIDDLRQMLLTRADPLAALFNAAFLDRRVLVSAAERIATQYASIDADDPVDRMQGFYAQTLLKQRLDMADRLGMAHSLEVRVPFCAEDVVAASLAIPASLNLGNGTEKNILRDAFRNRLPTRIVERPKAALPEAIGEEFQASIVTALREEVRTAPAGIWNVLNRETIAGLTDRLADAPWGSAQPLSSPLVFSKRHLFLLLTVMRWHRLNFEAR